MRILFVLATYYPHIGGVEYVVKSIAERLAEAWAKARSIWRRPLQEEPRRIRNIYLGTPRVYG